MKQNLLAERVVQPRLLEAVTGFLSLGQWDPFQAQGDDALEVPNVPDEAEDNAGVLVEVEGCVEGVSEVAAQPVQAVLHPDDGREQLELEVLRARGDLGHLRPEPWDIRPTVGQLCQPMEFVLDTFGNVVVDSEKRKNLLVGHQHPIFMEDYAAQISFVGLYAPLEFWHSRSQREKL